MDINNRYESWLEFDIDTKNELEGLSNEEINNRFYKEIEFGTGGLRGEVGAGTNRINYYTVYKVTMGVVKYLNKRKEKSSVVIAYDSRNYSIEFSYLIAFILMENNIDVKLFKNCTPTPVLRPKI